jgi:hypothetical protein
MGFSGYVSVCVQLYCVGFHGLSLHVSAYMANFKCVRYFYFHMSDKTDKEQRKASKHTHPHARVKEINEGNQDRKTQMETCRV